MPVDKNGKKIEVGHTVTLHLKVLSSPENSEYVNVQVEGDSKGEWFVLRAKDIAVV